MTWAHQPAPQQKAIADLAAQGNILMGLVALHTLHVPNNHQVRLAYCEHAVEYAQVSENHSLLSAALCHLGGSLRDIGSPAGMLQKHQEAAQYLTEAPPFLQSKLYIELAHAYARNGQVQEALRCIGEAHTTFPGENAFIPIFLSGDYGMFHLLLNEGQTYLNIGEHQIDGDHYQQAETVFAQIETLPSTIVIPERFRIEILNQQALAAMKTQNLERFCFYFEKGIQGAKALGSQQRRQEAIDLYWQGRKLWSHEGRVKELADLFISMN
jgi:tetratricopeptide (TPR) repeat protein